MDAFAILKLEPAPKLLASAVRSAFEALAPAAHPDRGGKAEHFAELCHARDQLLSYSGCLKAWALVKGIELAPSGPLAPELGAFFSELAPLRETVETLAARRQSAKTSLARSLAEAGLFELVGRIASLRERATIMLEACADELDSELSEERCSELWRQCRFLEKWIAELNELYVRCL